MLGVVEPLSVDCGYCNNNRTDIQTAGRSSNNDDNDRSPFLSLDWFFFGFLTTEKRFIYTGTASGLWDEWGTKIWWKILTVNNKILSILLTLRENSVFDLKSRGFRIVENI